MVKRCTSIIYLYFIPFRLVVVGYSYHGQTVNNCDLSMSSLFVNKCFPRIGNVQRLRIQWRKNAYYFSKSIVEQSKTIFCSIYYVSYIKGETMSTENSLPTTNLHIYICIERMEVELKRKNIAWITCDCN